MIEIVKGTDKQIAYATSIRSRAIEALRTVSVAFGAATDPRAARFAETADRLIADAEACDDAETILDGPLNIEWTATAKPLPGGAVYRVAARNLVVTVMSA